MKDMHSLIFPSQALNITTQSGTAVLNSAAIAVSSYHSLEVSFYTGAIQAGFTATCKLQESPDGSTNWTDVQSTDFLPSGVAPTLNAANQIVGLGYIGAQPFVRGVITPTVNAGNTTMGIIAQNINPMGNTSIVNNAQSLV